ncbi:heterokaryon incompatibility protein-domain-containing protein [Pisolithus albus]|nr:heterokaryon incompatibility protein-domain-containing protein [Pisolithus albus]
MRLLDVEAVLGRETDIRKADPEREILEELDDKTTSYAILSHRWGAEVGYEEMTGLMKMEERKRDEVRQRAGYRKIIKSCEQAKKDGYAWLWVDTCCIDKRSSAELSEAINSMYRWYQKAQICYAYLHDVGESIFPTNGDVEKFDESNGWPEWFVRGWTLQELIAPQEVKFFNKDWVHIGSKRQLAPTLACVTGIPRKVLTSGLARKHFSVAQIMSWAANRRTTREEDRAYSLMGLFGVNMPMLYGEGKKAFQRLQLEIIRISSDQSIFAWKPRIPRAGSVLAGDPSDFRDCGNIEKVDPDEFVDQLVQYVEWTDGHPWYIRRNIREIATNPIYLCRRAWLRWRARTLRRQLRTFTVSNAGIQVCLPVIPLPDSPSHCRAILACTHFSVLISIDLVSSGSVFDRVPDIVTIPKAFPEFKTLYLAHHEDVDEKCRNFILDDKHVSHYGFRRCGTYPHEFTGDAVTLSSPTGDLSVVVYANSNAGFRFAVGLGYHLGQEWVHVDYDQGLPTEEANWTDFGWGAYRRMWEARAKHARDMAKHGHVRHDNYCVKHAHLPRSIWAARVVWGRWEDDFKIMVDIVNCSGCCDGPRMTTTINDRNGLAIPGLTKTVSCSYLLHVDEWPARVDKCSSQRTALGDYGDYSSGNLVRIGNIFEDMRPTGCDPEDPTYCRTVFRVLRHGLGISMCWTRKGDDLTLARHSEHAYLALRQPKGISLPANEHVSLLLKTLSTRLAGKYLVTAIIQCSDFYLVDKDGNRRGWGDDSAPANGNHSTETGMLRPLHAIASPQVWSIEPPCIQRMERFRSIR